MQVFPHHNGELCHSVSLLAYITFHVRKTKQQILFLTHQKPWMRAHTHVHIHTWSSHFALSLHCHSSIPVCKMVSVLDWPGISVYRLNLINIHTPFRAASLSPHSELWNQSQCDHYMIVSCYRARSTHLFMLCVSITFSYSKWVPVTRSPLNSKALCIHTPQIYTQGSVRFFPFVWLCFCLCFVFVFVLVFFCFASTVFFCCCRCRRWWWCFKWCYWRSNYSVCN